MPSVKRRRLTPLIYFPSKKGKVKGVSLTRERNPSQGSHVIDAPRKAEPGSLLGHAPETVRRPGGPDHESFPSFWLFSREGNVLALQAEGVGGGVCGYW